MIVKVYDQSCIAIPKSPLVAGTAEKHTAEFQFSSNWDGLEKIAVFEASEGIRRVMEIIDNKCDVPWEMLSRPGFLKVGVIGVHEDTRLPTIWSPPMRIIPGAVSTHSPSGGYSKSFLESTLEACRAILAKVNEGALDVGVALQECREILDRILGAIYTPHISDEGVLSWTNTAGLPNPDPVQIVGEDGVSPDVSVTSITGGHRVTITDAEDTETFDVMDGVDGQDGADGAPGQGVPVGGTAGQILAKNSNTNYDGVWIDPPSGSMFVTLTEVVEGGVSTYTADHTIAEIATAYQNKTPVYIGMVEAGSNDPPPCALVYYADSTYCGALSVINIEESLLSLTGLQYFRFVGENDGNSDSWDVVIDGIAGLFPEVGNKPNNYVVATSNGQWVPVPISDIVPSGALYVNLTKDQNDVWTADKTVTEIVTAVNAGTPAYLIGDYYELGFSAIVPVVQSLSAGGTAVCAGLVVSGEGYYGGPTLDYCQITGAFMNGADAWTVEVKSMNVLGDPTTLNNGDVMMVVSGEWTPTPINEYVPTQTSISNGVVSFKNASNNTLFTLTLPVYNGGVS